MSLTLRGWRGGGLGDCNTDCFTHECVPAPSSAKTIRPVSRPSFQPKALNDSLILSLLPLSQDKTLPHSLRPLPVASPGSEVESIFRHQELKQGINFVLSEINLITLLCSIRIINLMPSE